MSIEYFANSPFVIYEFFSNINYENIFKLILIKFLY